MRNNNLIIDVEENPKKWYHWILFAMQHVLAVLVATITVPLIIPGIPIAATMIAAGIGTLFYILVTRKKSPVFLSSSFAYISPISSALAVGGIGEAISGTFNNYGALMLGMAMVGLIYTVIAIIIKFTGTGWLNKLLPPIVVGPTIMIIGLSLATSAVSNFSTIKDLTTNAQTYNLIGILCGLIALFVTAFVTHYGEGKTIGLVPFIIGMGSGYLAALLFTAIGYYGCHNDYFRIIDFTPLIEIFSPDKISGASFFNYNIFLPNTKDSFIFLRFEELAKFDWAKIGQIALLFIPVSLVTICEHIGDHKNLGNIIGRDLLGKEPGMTRTLIGDGVATAISGQLSGCANTTYGESVAVIGTTKIASINVMILAGILMIAFGLFTPFTALLQTMPPCVTGGVSVVLYGFIAVSGMKMIVHEHIDLNNSKNLFVLSTILVSGIGGLALHFAPSFKESTVLALYSEDLIKTLTDQGKQFSIFTNPDGAQVISYTEQVLSSYAATISPVAVAMILGIILNLVLRDRKKKDETPILEGAEIAVEPQEEAKPVIEEKETEVKEENPKRKSIFKKKNK